MNAAQLDDIRNAALNLPEDDRVKLANDLRVSLHGGMGTDIAAAWDIEICRRISEVEAGTAELYDAREVIVRAKARIGV